MVRAFEKIFFASQPAAKKKKFFLLSVIELLHPSLKIFLITLTVIWWGCHPRNSRRAQNVFVVKRRSRAALDNGNRLWCIKKVLFFYIVFFKAKKSYYIIQKQPTSTTMYCMIFLLFALYSIEIFRMTKCIIRENQWIEGVFNTKTNYSCK